MKKPKRLSCNGIKRTLPKAQREGLKKRKPGRHAGARYCKYPAGRRTEHLGTGRCHLHGGNNVSGPDSGLWLHGQFARSVKEKLPDELVPAFLGGLEDPELVSGRADISFANLYLLYLTEQAAKHQSYEGFREAIVAATSGLHYLDKADLDMVREKFHRVLDICRDPVAFEDVMRTVMRVTEQKRRLQAGERERLVDLEQMIRLKDLNGIIEVIARTVTEALNEHIRSEETRNKILAQLAKELRIKGDLAGRLAISA